MQDTITASKSMLLEMLMTQSEVLQGFKSAYPTTSVLLLEWMREESSWAVKYCVVQLGGELFQVMRSASVASGGQQFVERAGSGACLLLTAGWRWST